MTAAASLVAPVATAAAPIKPPIPPVPPKPTAPVAGAQTSGAQTSGAQPGGEVQPTAVTPQEVRARRAVHKAPPSSEVHEGDLICGECGEGNPPTRRFCSRCGASLSMAAPVHLPWWRRLLPKRAKKAAGAGGNGAAKKKKKKKGSTGALGRNIRRVLGAILLVSGIVYSVVPAVRSYVNTKTSAAITKAESIVRPQFVPTHPVEVTATGSNPAHPPSAIADGFTNTYWSAPTTGSEQVVTMRFERPTRLDRALVRVGVSGNFASTNRPQTIHVVYSTGKSQDLKLDDKADAQEVDLKSGGQVSTVELHITGLFRAVNSTDVAVTEIELFSKK